MPPTTDQQTQPFDAHTGQLHVYSTLPGVVIIYGNGADLGDFGIFAKALMAQLASRFHDRIIIKKITNKLDLIFYMALTAFPFRIAEFHIFSHAFGGGLALGYHMPQYAALRNNASNAASQQGRQISYEEVLATELGILFSDDMASPPYALILSSFQSVIQSKFTDSAFCKLWGCNGGVDGWRYSDQAGSYYWESLNSKNTPKLSIAKTLASYLKIPVWAASSGSHIEVLDNGKWISSNQYKKRHGRNPSGTIPLRLHPDKGDYNRFDP